MINQIGKITGPLTGSEIGSIDREKKAEASSFTEMLRESIGKVNQLQLESGQLTSDFALGKTDNIHEVTIAAEKAKIALNLTTAVQNKVIDAYKEIMRMQI